MGSAWCTIPDEEIDHFKTIEYSVRSDYEVQHPPDPLAPWWDFHKVVVPSQLTTAIKEKKDLTLQLDNLKQGEIIAQLRINQLNEHMAIMYQSMVASVAVVLFFCFILIFLRRSRKSTRKT